MSDAIRAVPRRISRRTYDVGGYAPRGPRGFSAHAGWPGGVASQISQLCADRERLSPVHFQTLRAEGAVSGASGRPSAPSSTHCLVSTRKPASVARLASPCTSRVLPTPAPPPIKHLIQAAAQRTGKLAARHSQEAPCLPLPGRQVINGRAPARLPHCALNCLTRHTGLRNSAGTLLKARQTEARGQDPHSFPTTSTRPRRLSRHIPQKTGHE
jgi:hypothetical protein